MRRLALACLALASCDSPDVINLGRKRDGTPKAQIWLDRQARQEALAAKLAAGQPKDIAQAGMPVPNEMRHAVLEGPVTVGLRPEGVSVVAGKAVPDGEAEARLAYVRAERLKAGSADVSDVTVNALANESMDRIFKAMSFGHRAGFQKIGYQIVEEVALPEPEPVAAAQPADESRLVVTVASGGAIQLGTETLDAAALSLKLLAAASARKEQSLPPPAVTLLADRDAPLTSVRSVLDACDTAGIATVTLGSPVAVSAGPVGPGMATMPDFGEGFRNWRLGIEDREPDFSEGPPAYWYYAAFHAWLDEEQMLVEATNDRLLNRERVRAFGARCGRRCDQMARLLGTVEPAREEVLKGLGADYRRLTAAAADGAGLTILRTRLKGMRSRIVQEFPPDSVSIPAGTAIPPAEPDPPKKE